MSLVSQHRKMWSTSTEYSGNVNPAFTLSKTRFTIPITFLTPLFMTAGDIDLTKPGRHQSMGLWAPGAGSSWSNYGVTTTSKVEIKLQKATSVTDEYVAVRRSLSLGSANPRFSVFGVGVGSVHLTLEVG